MKAFPIPGSLLLSCPFPDLYKDIAFPPHSLQTLTPRTLLHQPRRPFLRPSALLLLPTSSIPERAGCPPLLYLSPFLSPTVHTVFVITPELYMIALTVSLSILPLFLQRPVRLLSTSAILPLTCMVCSMSLGDGSLAVCLQIEQGPQGCSSRADSTTVDGSFDSYEHSTLAPVLASLLCFAHSATYHAKAHQVLVDEFVA